MKTNIPYAGQFSIYRKTCKLFDLLRPLGIKSIGKDYSQAAKFAANAEPILQNKLRKEHMNK